MGLALREHLAFGICAGRAIFLDYEENRYFCLSPTLNDLFLSLGGDPVEDDSEAARLLEQSGIVRVIPGQARISAPRIPLALATLSDAPIRLTIASFSPVTAIECFWAQYRIKRRPLRSLIDLDKARLLYERDRFVDADMVALVRHFHGLGRLIRNRDRCLANSIALRRRLEHDGFGAALVFGVRLYPFQAHCWLQRGITVLNDHHEHVAQFTPVLAA